MRGEKTFRYMLFINKNNHNDEESKIQEHLEAMILLTSVLADVRCMLSIDCVCAHEYRVSAANRNESDGMSNRKSGKPPSIDFDGHSYCHGFRYGRLYIAAERV